MVKGCSSLNFAHICKKIVTRKEITGTKFTPNLIKMELVYVEMKNNAGDLRKNVLE